MNELTRIISQFENCFKGTPMAWHGASTLPLLQDISAEKAQIQAMPDAHTIWEVVHHMTVWKEEARKCLHGGTFPFLPTEKEWPPVNDTSEKAWEVALENLVKTHQHLLDAIAGFDTEKLDDPISIDKSWPDPWSTTSYYGLLHGTLHHDVYHTGQIAILKKKLQ